MYASALASHVAERPFERWIVVVDACYAFRVGELLAGRLNRLVGRMRDARYVVLSSVDALDEAYAGMFTDALAAVLREGPEQQWWSLRQRFLHVDTVLKRLEAYLRQHHPEVDPPVKLTGEREVSEWFPNPLYRETAVAEALDEGHFLPKAQGVEAGETGWFFTGRVDALRRIRSWLKRPDQPLLVVTGSAGTGTPAPANPTPRP